MNRWLVLGVVSFLLVVGSAFSAGSVMTDRCINETCVIQAKTSPVGVLVALAMLTLVFAHKQSASVPREAGTVRLRMRIGAGVVDFLAAASIIGPLTALPMLVYAAITSGPFLWAVQSIDPNGFDHALAVGLMFCALSAFFAYFYLPPRRGRLTLGQYIFGYKMIGQLNRRPNYLMSGSLAFIGVIVWPISIFLAFRRPDREFWWSVRAGFRAVRIEEREQSKL